MLKAYATYKESVNPVKKEKTGEPATPAQSALKALESAHKKVMSLDAGALGVDKEALTAALTGM